MGVQKEALAFALVFILIMLSLKAFMGESDTWGPYYYRQAQRTYELGTTFYKDDLSYLGRDFTYPPAYFMFAAQMAYLVQAPCADAIRFLLHVLVVGLAIFTTYLLFENLEKRARLLSALMFTLYTFYFITNVGITLHALSFLMLNSAVIFFRRKEPFASALGVGALSTAFSIHPVSLFAFPVYVYATGFSLDLRKLAIYGVGAVLLSLPLYLPIFLKSGLPNEIVPTQWGYAHAFGFDGMYMDALFLIPMALLAFAFGLARGERRNALILAIFFLATAYVSFRANILLAIFLAGFFPKVFKKEVQDAGFYALFLITVLLNLAFQPVIYSGVTDWCSWGSANWVCISPMKYLSEYTPTQSKLALDPEYAHLETYYGGRPVLADLYVEYADEKKFFAEAMFFYGQNASALYPYGIDLMLMNDKWGVKRSVNDTDRVYDNGYVHIFRRNPSG